MGFSFKLCSKSLASRELARDAPPAGYDPVYKILWDWCVWKMGLGTLNHLGTAEGCHVVASVLGCQKSCLVGGQRDKESSRGNQMLPVSGGCHFSDAVAHRAFMGRKGRDAVHNLTEDEETLKGKVVLFCVV